MGKITTVFLLFLSLFFFSFEIQAKETHASCVAKLGAHPGSYCARAVGGQCAFGLEQCNAANCSKYGGTMVNGVCSPNASVAITNKSCKKFLGAKYDDSNVCRCSNGHEVDLNGPLSQCSDLDNAKVDCTNRGGFFSSSTDTGESLSAGICLCNGKQLAAGAKCNEENHSAAAECENRGGTISAYTESGETRAEPLCTCQGAILADGARCSGPGVTSADPDISQCTALMKLAEDVKSCVDKSNEAVKACDQDKSGDAGLQESKAILATVGDAFIKSKAGSGKSSACAQGSLALSTSLGAFDMFKSNCDTHFEGCKNTCGEARKILSSGSAVEECRRMFTPEQLVAMETPIREKAQYIKDQLVQGEEICTVKAAKENNAANTILKDLARSTQAAKICECKQATGGSSTCDNIVSPTACLPGGALYGSTQCAMYGSCQLGSADYATVKCQCALGKTTVGCNTPAAAVTSNFAGIDTKPASSNSGGIDVGAGAGSGGSGSDNFDLSGVSGPKSGGDDKDVAKATNAGLTAGSGGGGGGGGSPAASPDGAAAAGAAEGEAGSGSSNGLFGMVKSMFGSGSGGSGSGSSNKTGAAKDAKYKLDYKKWAEGQKRCFASVSSTEHCQQRAGKNQDIFEVVKGRYLADPAVNPYLVPGK